MNVCVYGLWHLGTVTAACLANRGFHVVGLDDEHDNIQRLKQGKAALYEPGLDELLSQGITSDVLEFTNDPVVALNNTKILWITFDTPVDETDQADVAYVEHRIMSLFEFLEDGTNVIISSQVPVGFTRQIEVCYAEQYPERHVRFAYSPENLRLGKAIKVFLEPDRIVVGVRTAADKDAFLPVFTRISERVEWMGTESAEMTKHGINAFLATSVVFANELASLCEMVGADAKEVERGLKSDSRIGTRAYLGPGGAFSGGTLARDIQFLIGLGQQKLQKTLLFRAVKESNDHHKTWVRRTCEERLHDMNGRKIALLGLTYKPGTDTLRRSAAVELARWLFEKGAIVQAFDPQISTLPESLTSIIALKASIEKALADADCVIIATEWPIFRELDERLIELMGTKIVIDANRFLEKRFERYPETQYIAVGRG